MTGDHKHIENSLVALLAEQADQRPDHPALVGTTTVYFAGLWEDSLRLAAGLREIGVTEGDRVLVMVPMSIDVYRILVAIWILGATAVFIDPWQPREQIGSIAAFAEPRAFIGVPKSHLLRLSTPGLRDIPLAVSTGMLGARYTLAGLMKRDPLAHWQAVARDDPALITFTSGSSNTPKGAERSHAMLRAQHQILATHFPYPEQAVDMVTFPVFALNNLAMGITTVIPEVDLRRIAAARPGPLVQQILRHHVTHVTASPPFFDRLAEAHLPPPLHRIMTGGAPVTGPQLKRWRRAWPRAEILILYGSTEAEPVAHCTMEERLEREAQTARGCPGFYAGHPVPEIQTRIASLEDPALEVDPGTPGELLVSGPHVGQRYYRSPEATAANKFRDPGNRLWHRMGDTGYFDDQGAFWITGRTHAVIRHPSGLLHPLLVEQAAARTCPPDTPLAAVGIPGEGSFEKLVVVIQGTAIDKEAVRQALEAEGFPADEILVNHDPLPTDPRHNQKIDYPRLREALMKRS